MSEDVKHILTVSFGGLMVIFVVTVGLLVLGWLISLAFGESDYHDLKHLCNKMEREVIYEPKELMIYCKELE
jgi:hypothetical protein